MAEEMEIPMPTLSLHLAPGILVAFMLALAVVPLAIIWVDERRRGNHSARLARLRQEAQMHSALALAVGVENTRLRRGVRLPNG
jgi:hypothetical protein